MNSVIAIRMPFILVGNARHEPIRGPHPLAYGLFLTDLFLKEQQDIEVYDAAFLIPVIAALCDRKDGILAVKGGSKKFGEMLRAPSGEFEGRLYELLVAGRAAEKGRSVEFVEPGVERSPDLRITDFAMPVTVECKFQSRWSETEIREIEVVRAIFADLCAKYVQKGFAAVIEVTFSKRIGDVDSLEVLDDLEQQLDSFIPFGTRDCSWGNFQVSAIAPEVEWSVPTRLYGPDFLSHVFKWDAEHAAWDGICTHVRDAETLLTQRARLPFGLKWRLAHRADEFAKARDVVRNLQEAANQIPVGEAGCLYVGFEDSHRSALADLRTKRIIERLPSFYHRKRGANIQYMVVTRLYPCALGNGKPDLIESCIPASVDKDPTWPELMPTLVLVPEEK